MNRQTKGRSQYADLLRRYLLPQKHTLWVLAALLVLTIGLQLANPQIIRYFIDSAQSGSTLEPLLVAALLFIGFSVLQGGVTVLATYFSENLGWKTTNALRSDLAAHCLSLDMPFHKSQTSGAIIERVDGDVNALANFFSSMIIHLLGNFLLMVGIIVLLFRESWMIGAGMTVFVIVAVFVIQQIRKFNGPFWKDWRQASAELYGFIGEQLEGTEDIRANGVSGFVMGRFYGMLKRMLRVRLRAFIGFASMWNMTIIVFTLGNAMALRSAPDPMEDGRDLARHGLNSHLFDTELPAKPSRRSRTQMEDFGRRTRSISPDPHAVRDAFRSIQDGPGSRRFRMDRSRSPSTM